MCMCVCLCFKLACLCVLCFRVSFMCVSVCVCMCVCVCVNPMEPQGSCIFTVRYTCFIESTHFFVAHVKIKLMFWWNGNV